MSSTLTATMPFASRAPASISHAPSMDASNDSIGRVTRDSLLLGALLAGLNYVLARADAGWLELNPTPWLLPALLIGGRYGVTSGTLIGLLTALGISLVRSHADGVEPWAFATEHRYMLTGLVLGGFLAGQLNQMLRGDTARLQRDGSRLKDHVERLQSELGLVNETRHELQQRLALYNAPLACLDTEMRKLVSQPADEIFGALLQLLHRLAGVTSAGIYTQEGGSLRRDAVIHPTAPLAPAIPLAETRLASKALEEKTIASLSHPLESSKEQPFLAAIPWSYKEHAGVLLIQDMPLESFEWHNLARIEVIMHWALTMRRHAESIGFGIAARKLMPLEDFMMLLAQALETEQTHRLPSAVIRFDLKPGDSAVSSDGRQITRALPATALTTRTPDGGFVSLLPFTGDHGAEAVARGINELLPSVRTSHYLVVGPAKLEELWTRILEL